VELCPHEEDIASSFAAARLVYKVLNYHAYYAQDGKRVKGKRSPRKNRSGPRPARSPKAKRTGGRPTPRKARSARAGSR